MVFFRKLEVFLWLYGSRAEAFVCLNHHTFRVILDKSDSPAVKQEEIVADGAEIELRFQGLEKCLKALFECKLNVPSTQFPF